MRDVLVTEIGLKRAGVDAVVGQLESTSMAQFALALCALPWSLSARHGCLFDRCHSAGPPDIDR
jgi:hypothetical protein